MVEVGEGVGRPKLLLQFLSCHHFTSVFQQTDQNLEWLILKLHLHTVLTE
jgi:hypothetical protein